MLHDAVGHWLVGIAAALCCVLAPARAGGAGGMFWDCLCRCPPPPTSLAGCLDLADVFPKLTVPCVWCCHTADCPCHNCSALALLSDCLPRPPHPICSWATRGSS